MIKLNTETLRLRVFLLYAKFLCVSESLCSTYKLNMFIYLSVLSHKKFSRRGLYSKSAPFG